MIGKYAILENMYWKFDYILPPLPDLSNFAFYFLQACLEAEFSFTDTEWLVTLL